MKFTSHYIKNDVFRVDNTHIDIAVSEAAPSIDNKDLLDVLRDNKKDIQEKSFGHISSFNFSRDVFNSSRWSDLSKIARGLFIDNVDGRIVARGFDKFFNYRERDFNQPDWLKDNLKFPVAAYLKYNGFLGILSYDKVEKKFLFCTKSMIDGAYSTYFKDIFYSTRKDEGQAYFQELASHLVESNACLVFEIIDPSNDPHIVEYADKHLVLLDEIFLEKSFKHISYDELKAISVKFKFPVKSRPYVFYDWDNLYSFIVDIEKYDSTKGIEGYVLEDATGYHFKLKGGWYKFWKAMRGYKQKLAAGHIVSTSGLTTPLMNDVYGFMKRLGRDELQKMSIIDVRNAFEKVNANASKA
jgi:tRNA splicing ligase